MQNINNQYKQLSEYQHSNGIRGNCQHATLAYKSNTNSTDYQLLTYFLLIWSAQILCIYQHKISTT